jgi:hypothetical protein
MKRILIFIILVITYTTATNGQSFAFIGENSFQSTEKYTLQSNSDKEIINDLLLVFAKDGDKGLIILSSKLTNSVKISGKLIIYLDDGTVISCVDRGVNDNVDDIALSAYYLTTAELTKMKQSNINTIRYQIECPRCGPLNSWEGIYSASNQGNSISDFPKIITEFYKK